MCGVYLVFLQSNYLHIFFAEENPNDFGFDTKRMENRTKVLFKRCKATAPKALSQNSAL